MKLGHLKNCMHYLKLKQGTVLIAITQLFMSGFTMTLLVLALTHNMEIGELVARDKEDALEREAMEEISSKHLNSKRMDVAHDKATETLYFLYYGLMMSVIHFIATMLLLYGVLVNNRHFMAPWIMVMMTEIVVGIISLFLVQQDCPFIAMLGGSADVTERLMAFFITMVNFCMWLVVYSTYKSLEIKKGCTHRVHDAKKRPETPATTNAKLRASAPQPFEV